MLMLDSSLSGSELEGFESDDIYVPKDWEQVVVQARQKNPFRVCKINREDFVSLKPLKAAIVNRKKNTVGGKVKEHSWWKGWMAENALDLRE